MAELPNEASLSYCFHSYLSTLYFIRAVGGLSQFSVASWFSSSHSKLILVLVVVNKEFLINFPRSASAVTLIATPCFLMYSTCQTDKEHCTKAVNTFVMRHRNRILL